MKVSHQPDQKQESTIQVQASIARAPTHVAAASAQTNVPTLMRSYRRRDFHPDAAHHPPGVAAMQPGTVMLPCPMSMSAKVGVHPARTA